MKSSFTCRKHISSFRTVRLLFAIAPLWLVPAAVKTTALAQTPDDVSNAATAASLADWTEFHRDNMQRWNPYERVLGVNNVESLQLKWKNSIVGVYLRPAVSSLLPHPQASLPHPQR